MARDIEETKSRLLKAVGILIARKGFQEIGINAIAREAGVDKVLIYRYFGGLPQLLGAFAVQGDFWPTTGQLIGGSLEDLEKMSGKDLSVAVLKGYLREMRKRISTQEILRWELLERNELTDELARAREQQGMEILNRLPYEAKPSAKVDLAPAAAILQAGLIYLVLRSKTADTYLGIDLHSDQGWKRIERAIETLVHAYFSHLDDQRKERANGNEQKKLY